MPPGHTGWVADRLPPGTFVVVSGPPASGKTTLARTLRPALGLPVMAKDTIKEALMTVLPVPDVPASR
jgi:predicted kinase